MCDAQAYIVDDAACKIKNLRDGALVYTDFYI